MIESIKAPIRRRWPRLKLRTILLITLVFVAALPGIGALFLRVYENTLVRQTEAELVAQGAALAAVAAADWPPLAGRPKPPIDEAGPPSSGMLSTIDLRTTPVLPERPAPVPIAGAATPASLRAAARLAPVLRATARTTLASIILLDDRGRILVGPDPGDAFRGLPEVTAALGGRADTVLRRNAAYRAHYALEWLSRASDLRIHYARPVIVDGRVAGVLLLSRSPRALFRGLYDDRGKILFGIAAIFATLVLLSGLLSRGIAQPIESLSEATRQVARGAGSIPAPPQTAAIEIQALYADFAVMADAIARRSRYLRDFAHAVSHEFKTPLASIRGTIEILEDHGPAMSAAERRQFHANIAQDAARLDRLVVRLLDLARADMTEIDTAASSDLASVVHRVADAYRATGIAVTVDLAEALPPIALPGAMLETILDSLIDNSRQAGATRIDLHAHLSGSRIELAVADDGPGIPAGDRARIFEPFFTARRASGGTGLGLPIARSLLSAHYGSIELSDSPSGATFILQLPLRA
ncbi:MAG: sensor histidine kinase [Sphingomonas sp.]